MVKQIKKKTQVCGLDQKTQIKKISGIHPSVFTRGETKKKGILISPII
jgi:hypothetical protein